MIAPGPRQRLDILMVTRGLVATRARARDLVLRGLVSVDGVSASKPAQSVPETVSIEIAGDAGRHVSRGAAKLIAAIDAFGFDPRGCDALDIGASTGGFTQVLIEHDAAHVWAVDVGTDQLAPDLRNNPRVTFLEGMDARRLTTEHVRQPVTAIVADVSFISLTKALPAALKLAQPGCWLVALIKPQFEAGRAAIGKGGIVRDEAMRVEACEAVLKWLGNQPGWRVTGSIESPIRGSDGNREVLAGAVLDP